MAWVYTSRSWGGQKTTLIREHRTLNTGNTFFIYLSRSLSKFLFFLKRTGKGVVNIPELSYTGVWGRNPQKPPVGDFLPGYPQFWGQLLGSGPSTGHPNTSMQD